MKNKKEGFFNSEMFYIITTVLIYTILWKVLSFETVVVTSLGTILGIIIYEQSIRKDED